MWAGGSDQLYFHQNVFLPVEERSCCYYYVQRNSWFVLRELYVRLAGWLAGSNPTGGGAGGGGTHSMILILFVVISIIGLQ